MDRLATAYPQLPLPAPVAPRRRLGGAVGVLLLVLAGHAVLLQGWATLATVGERADAAPAPPPTLRLQVRQLAVAAPAPPAVPVPGSPRDISPAQAESTRSQRPEQALQPVRAPAGAPEAQAVPAAPEPLRNAGGDTSIASSMTTPVVASAATSPPGDGTSIPVYATRMPPAATLGYELRRGLVSGRGQLAWQPGDSQYVLSLEGRALGTAFIEQSSRGGFDAAGIAPLRFVDKRRGRDAQAANFQRDKGIVTFSGPDLRSPLWPGTQDRLSWMVQLPAIVAADPARFGVGTSVTLFVVGARGDAGAWTFDVVSTEALSLPAGPVAGALHLRREPRRPYDTLVDVWLDPARHHLPVKVRLAVSQTDDATEFSLQSLTLP